MGEKRCEERVWDNGDTTDCGNALPCPQHPEEENVAKRALRAVDRRAAREYELGETHVGRLKEIREIVEGGMPKKKRATIRLESVKEADGWGELAFGLGLSDEQRAAHFEHGEYATLELVIDEDLNVVGGRVVPRKP